VAVSLTEARLRQVIDSLLFCVYLTEALLWHVIVDNTFLYELQRERVSTTIISLDAEKLSSPNNGECARGDAIHGLCHTLATSLVTATI
jgi:hypothetical protein